MNVFNWFGSSRHKDRQAEEIEALQQHLVNVGNELGEYGKMLYAFVSILERHPRVYRALDSVFRREGAELAMVKRDAERFINFWFK